MDYVFDPVFATIGGTYLWVDSGAYLGIPFKNFTGWILCTYTIFQVYALVTLKMETKSVTEIMNKKLYWHLPVLIYVSLFIQIPILMMFGENVSVTDLSGVVFQTKDIYEVVTLVGIIATRVRSTIRFINVFNNKELK